MTEGFVLRTDGKIDPLDVGRVETNLSLTQSLIRNFRCLFRRCDPRDQIHLRRKATRGEAHRYKAGWISYGLICGRCDRLIAGMRTEPMPGTI